MSIHSNTSYHTAIDFSHSEDNQSFTSSDKRVEGVAFDVLCSQQPIIDKSAEQIRFKLEEHVKTGSQSYTIVTWNDKKYRITVHKNKSQVSYSEGDWKRLGDRLKTKIWDKAHPGQHFSQGTLSLNAKTRKKWNVTLNNPTYTERPIAKKIIKDLKKMFEKELTILHISPAPKSSVNQSKNSSPTSPTRKNLSGTQEKKKTLLDKIIEKSTNRFFPDIKKEDFDDLTSETSSQPEETRSRAEDGFDFISDTTSIGSASDIWEDLTSETTSQPEETRSRAEDGFDLISDTTSIGRTSKITDILEDQGPLYSPKIN